MESIAGAYFWTGSVNAFTDLDDRGIPALGAGTKSIVPV